MALKDHKELQELINSLVKEGFEDGYRLIYSLFDGDEYPEHSELGWSEVEKYGKIYENLIKDADCEHMESDGGGEGEGEYCYGVVRLKDKYYKAEWQYYSYHGCEYDDIEHSIHEVVPKQKTITVYESVSS